MFENTCAVALYLLMAADQIKPSSYTNVSNMVSPSITLLSIAIPPKYFYLLTFTKRVYISHVPYTWYCMFGGGFNLVVC